MTLIRSEELDKRIRHYELNVVLIKTPDLGTNYEDVLPVYESFVKKDTLIVSDNEIKSPSLIAIGILWAYLD